MKKVIFITLYFVFYIFNSYSVEKIVSEDNSINEISKIAKDGSFPPEHVIIEEENNSETLIAIIIRHSSRSIQTTNTYKDSLETIKLEDDNRLIFIDTLKPGIYIKISTTYDEDEGLRRLKKFNKIFSSIIGYKENGKYNIVMGPLEEREIDNRLEAIRKFGYIDVIIIKK